MCHRKSGSLPLSHRHSHGVLLPAARLSHLSQKYEGFNLVYILNRRSVTIRKHGRYTLTRAERKYRSARLQHAVSARSVGSMMARTGCEAHLLVVTYKIRFVSVDIYVTYEWAYRGSGAVRLPGWADHRCSRCYRPAGATQSSSWRPGHIQRRCSCTCLVTPSSEKRRPPSTYSHQTGSRGGWTGCAVDWTFVTWHFHGAMYMFAMPQLFGTVWSSDSELYKSTAPNSRRYSPHPH